MGKDVITQKMEEEEIEYQTEYKNWRLFGIKWAPLAIPLERRLQTFASFFWITCFFLMGLGSPFFLVYLFFCTKYYYVSVIYLIWIVWDWNTPKKGGRRIEWVREWKIWKLFADYFPVRLVKTCELDPTRNYIFGCHPHGVLCASHFACFGTGGTNFASLFPGLTTWLLTVKLIYCLPFYREFVMAGGFLDVSRESIHHILTKPIGQVCCIIVGGAAESMYAHPGKTTLVVKNRKGFVKMALRYGANLVPVFSFGENLIFKQLDNPEGSWVRLFQDTMRRFIGGAPLLFKGRGVFQYSYGLVPFRKPIHTVVGSPIDVPKMENPTKEAIEEYHKKYLDGLRSIYEEHKHEYSHDPEAELVFI